MCHVFEFSCSALPSQETFLTYSQIGFFRDATGVLTAATAVNLDQPHDDLRMPVKTVAIIDIQRIVEVVLGIFGEPGIGLVQHLV